MPNPTVDTYNKFPKEYAEKFSHLSVSKYIDQAFDKLGKENPRVVELGCGSGRDAEEICKRTNSYKGVDISEGLLEIASQKNIPDAKFYLSSIQDYSFEGTVDIIFAVASLLHLNKEDFSQVLKRAHKALSDQGLFQILVKYGEYKGEEIVKDIYGERIFYFYQLSDIKNMAAGYEVVYEERKTVGKKEWISILLRKK